MTPPMTFRNSKIIYYGPHQCARCGVLICKMGHEFGGNSFKYPEGPIYPNTEWHPHVCTPGKFEHQGWCAIHSPGRICNCNPAKQSSTHPDPGLTPLEKPCTHAVVGDGDCMICYPKREPLDIPAGGGAAVAEPAKHEYKPIPGTEPVSLPGDVEKLHKRILEDYPF